MSEKPMPAGRLTGRDHWDTINASWSLERAQARIEIDLDWRARTKVAWTEYYFWNQLLPRYVKNGGKVVELGAAPGAQALQFAAQFAAEPFGVEYSPEGVAVTKANFRRHQYPEENVIGGDIFDRAQMAPYAGAFDAVLSRGLIEHFTEPELAIRTHVELAKPGGLVIITVPTLTGIHYLSTKLLAPHALSLHNLSIMNKRSFQSLFTHPELEPLCCSYTGGPNLLVGWNEHPTKAQALLQNFLCRAQAALNLSQYSTGEWAEWWWVHSNLVYIGRRRK